MSHLKPEDVKFEIIVDKPLTGMWHCGPNHFWIEATHLPTLNMVRVYSSYTKSQHLAKEKALSLLELSVDDPDHIPYAPERITQRS